MTQRIVVGIDDSDSARQALHWAMNEAELRKVPVHAIHTLTYVTWAEPWVIPSVDNVRESVMADAKSFLSTEIEKALQEHVGVQVEQVVAEGPAAEILIEASKDAEMVVVGSRGRGGFAGLLLGSVSQHVVHHAHCPVVVVR